MKKLLLYIFLFQFLLLQSQEAPELRPELITKFNKATAPTDKINLAIAIGGKYLSLNNDSAFYYCNLANTLANQTNSPSLKAFAAKSLSESYHFLRNPVLRDSLIDLALVYFKEAGDLKGEASTTYHKGNYLKDDGSYKEAFEKLYQSVNLARKAKAESTEGWSLMSIGELMYSMGKSHEALSYTFMALKIMEKIKSEDGISFAYSDLGIFYDTNNMPDSAIYYYNLGAEHIKKTNKFGRLADTYMNIGVLYFYQKDYYKAVKMLKMALDVNKDIDYPENKGAILVNLGEVYMEQGLYTESEKSLQEGIKLFTELHNTAFLREAYRILSQLYANMGQYQKAYSNYQLFHSLNDSILNTDNNRAMTEMQVKYDTDAKRKEIALLNSQKQLKDVEIKRQRLYIFGALGVLLIIIVFSVLLFNRFKVIQKQKQVIEEQKHIVEEHQKEILDSIHYAKRIQQAQLPTQKYIEKQLETLKKKN